MTIEAIERPPAGALSTAVTLLLALTGSFAVIAGVSALARLVTYTAVSLATLRLRNAGFPPAAFALPFGAAIPVAATAVSLATIGGATREQFTVGALALAAGAILFACNQWQRIRSGPLAPGQGSNAG